MTTNLTERIARWVYKELYYYPLPNDHITLETSWKAAGESTKEGCRKVARALLPLVEAAQGVVVLTLNGLCYQCSRTPPCDCDTGKLRAALKDLGLEDGDDTTE